MRVRAPASRRVRVTSLLASVTHCTYSRWHEGLMRSNTRSAAASSASAAARSFGTSVPFSVLTRASARPPAPSPRLRAENETSVLAAEAERIRHHIRHRCVPGLIRHHVERDGGVRNVVIDRRRYAAVLDRQQ